MLRAAVYNIHTCNVSAFICLDDLPPSLSPWPRDLSFVRSCDSWSWSVFWP